MNLPSLPSYKHSLLPSRPRWLSSSSSDVCPGNSPFHWAGRANVYSMSFASLRSCPNRKFYLLNIFLLGNNISLSSNTISTPFPSARTTLSCSGKGHRAVPGQDDEKAIFHPTLSLLFSKLSTSALPPTPTEQLVRWWCWMVGGQTVGRSIFYCCLGGSSSTSRGGNNNPATVQYLLYHSSHPDNYLMGINWGEEDETRLFGISVAFVIKIIIIDHRSFGKRGDWSRRREVR